MWLTLAYLSALSPQRLLLCYAIAPSYSLMEIFDKILGWKFTNTQFTTGLPEYRCAREPRLPSCTTSVLVYC
jgi:hypothetical protein